MTAKIEVFYTGGGITIAEADIDSAHYAVVSSEAPDFLTVYTLTDEEKTYLPDDMVFSAHRDEVPPKYKAIYAGLVDKLKTA